jgi:hypothetical protein
MALAYCAVQWKRASAMGGTRIFSSSRQTDRANFAAMVTGISQATEEACRSGGVHSVFFDDHDVVVPYLELDRSVTNGCHIIRETVVTPFSKAELQGCDVEVIRESSPYRRDTELAVTDGLDLPPWSRTIRWFSSDGRFGFAAYRHPC